MKSSRQSNITYAILSCFPPPGLAILNCFPPPKLPNCLPRPRDVTAALLKSSSSPSLDSEEEEEEDGGRKCFFVRTMFVCWRY